MMAIKTPYKFGDRVRYSERKGIFVKHCNKMPLCGHIIFPDETICVEKSKIQRGWKRFRKYMTYRERIAWQYATRIRQNSKKSCAKHKRKGIPSEKTGSDNCG